MWNYFWPIVLVISANTFYHICAKSTPSQGSPFATLFVLYLTAAAISAAIFFCSGQRNLMAELKTVNWTSFLFGCSIVALEFGYIQVYRVGWNVSIGSLVANIGLACVLVLVGVLLYHETLSINKLAGIAFCLVGFVLINR